MNGKNYIRSLSILGLWTLMTVEARAWHPDSSWVFNQWELGVSLGSALNDPGDMEGGFSSIWQMRFYHQYSPEDFGPQTPRHFFPAVGLVLSYADFSRTPVYREVNPPQEIYRGDYGRFFSLAISFSRYHRMWGSRHQWRLRSAIENGFAWAFNPYHYPDGMGNTIGGNFQIYFHAGLFASYAWGHHEIAVGPEFTHFSNSGVYLPNGGVNNIAVGLRYRTLAQTDYPHTAKEGYKLDEFLPYLYSSFYVSIGIHGEGDRGDRAEDHADIAVYSQLNLSYDLMFRFTPVVAMGLGTDFFSGCKANQLTKSWVGLGLKHESIYRHLSISACVGVYLNGMHPKGRGDSGTRIYEKIGLKYYLPVKVENVSQPYVSYHIKGNEFYAEQFEIGIGFIFDRHFRSAFVRKVQKSWEQAFRQQE